MHPLPPETSISPSLSPKTLSQFIPLLRSHTSWLGVPFILDSPPGTRIKVLDYSNPGILSQALLTYATHFTCISPDPAHIAAFNTWSPAAAQARPHLHASAVQGDMAVEDPADEVCGPELWNFDLAGVCLGFHELPDPALAVRKLVERLTAGKGVLLVVDFLPYPDPKIVEAGMRRLFAAVGLEDFAFTVPSQKLSLSCEDGGHDRRGEERPVFLVRARKAPTAWGKLGRWLGGVQDAVAGQGFSPRDVRREGGGSFDLKTHRKAGEERRDEGKGYGWFDVKNVKIEKKGEAWNPMRP